MFKNRQEAGRKLSNKLLEALKADKVKGEILVLAIPRGGVVTGKEIAVKLKTPLDIIITKKIGAPSNPELAIGAVGPGGEEVIDERLVSQVGADEEYIKNQKLNIKKEIERREKELRGGKPQLNYKDKIIILTDDGVATGATILAGIEVLRQHHPKKIIVAVPVIARDTLGKIEAQADAVIYLEAPWMFFAVGQFYENFPQTTDEEVKEILSN
jgi:putative phosphoribosyl transferase